MAKKGKYIYDWPRPMVTVDAVVFAFFPPPPHSCLRQEDMGGDTGAGESKAKLLLIKRRYEPFKDKWALPGGFVDIDEELEDAVARELAEETGLAGVRLEQMHTFGNVGRDPRGRQITIAFMGIVRPPAKGQNKIKAGDDAAEARWFDIEKLPKDMGFDHEKIARFAIEKLKTII
jgi:8-oxo-dGTP diphosphatase